MSNSPIPEVARVERLTARRWLMACLAVSVLIPSIGHAQLTTPTLTTPIMDIESGFHWFPEGAIAGVTVSDRGTPTAFATVKIEFRDTAGKLVAAKTGQLGPGRPVHLLHQNRAGSGLQQLSASVTVEGLADAGNSPVTVFEGIGPMGLVWVIGVCGMSGPPGRPGGVQEMCPGPFLPRTL